MKIHEDYTNYEPTRISIVNATYMGDFKIQIMFSDNTSRVVDFNNFLKKATHPSVKKYLNENNFKSFQIEGGNLNWNDFDMIFPLSDLKSGNI